MMNRRKRYIVPIVPFIVVAVVASLSSCGSNPDAEKLDNKQPAPTPTQNSNIPAVQPQVPKPLQPRVQSPESPFHKGTTRSNQTVNVTLYTSDSQCQELVPQTVPVSAEEPVAGAVGKIIEERGSADFNLTGYRVSVNDGVATVDLRIAPNSPRQFVSLSSCEQFALFGSLRKTLLSNSQWGIKNVRFTERGKEIVL
jgi:hypothetical protein